MLRRLPVLVLAGLTVLGVGGMTWASRYTDFPLYSQDVSPRNKVGRSTGSTAYMVIAQRDINRTYKWGLFPAKYYQPAAPNPDESRSYDYLTITVQ